MNPADDLKDEHEVIKTFTKVLEEMIVRLSAGRKVDADDLSWLFEFQRDYVDRSHFGKEECLLYPAMKDAGVPESPIGELVSEHEILRSLAKTLRGAVEDYREGTPPADIIGGGYNYITLMDEHIAKEEGIFYPLIEGVLPREHLDRISLKFARFEAGRIGLGRSSELEELIDYLKIFY